MTVLFFVAVVSFPAFTYFFLRSYKSRLEDEEFKARFETLYMNVDTKSDRPILMMTLFIFRRLVYAANIVFFTGSTVSQLFT
jgi:hypothetical protein